MPNVDNIKSLADIQALKKEFQFIVGGLSEIKNNIVDLNKYEILGKSKSSFRDVTVATKELNTTLEKNIQLNRSMVQQQIQEERLRVAKARALEAEAKSEKAVVDLVMKEEKARRANAAAIEKENAAKLSNRKITDVPFEIKGNLGGDPTDGGQITNFDDTRDALNDVDRAYAQTTNSAVTLSDVQTTLGRDVKKTTETVVDQNTTFGYYNKNLKNATLGGQFLVKNINDLTAANKELVKQRNAVDITTAEGKILVAKYNEQIDINNKRIKENSSQLEKQKQSVGAYATGFKKGAEGIVNAGQKIFGVVRTLAYILPGLGIAGIFSLAGDAIVGLVQKLGGASAATKRLKEEQEAYKKLVDESISSMAEEVAQVDVLIASYQKETTTKSQRKEIIKELKNIAPEYFGLLDEEKAKVEDVTAAYGKFNEGILASIEARVLSRQLEDLIEKRIKLEKSLQSGLTQRVINGKLINVLEAEYVDMTDANYRTRKQREDDLVNLKREELRIAQRIAQLKPPEDKTTKEKKEKKGRDAVSDDFKNEQERRKALFEILKLNLQDQISINEQILNDDSDTYDKRFALANLSYDKFVQLDNQLFERRKSAAQGYYDVSLELIRKQKDFEISELGEQENEDIRKAQKQITNVTQQAKVIQSIRDEYTAKRKLAETKANSDILKLNETSEKQFTELAKKSFVDRAKAKEEIEKQSIEHNKSLHDQEMVDIQNRYDEEMLLLDRKFARGRIKENDYNRRRLRLQLALQIELLQADIKFTKDTIALAEARAAAEGDPVKRQQMNDQIIAAKGKLAALEIKLQQTITDFEKTTNKTRLDEYEKFFNKVKDISQNVFDIISGFIGATAEKEKNAIQEQIDLLERKKQKDIEVANQTITNATDRANAITAIEARADAQRAILEQRQRQADERRARFEKAATIAKIIIETASAVIHQLNSGDPVTALGRAIAVGALGAAQLAVAVATPIPKYKHGVKYHPGGFAIVGDGGRAEGITMPDGTVFKSPASPTLMDLPVGASVDPDFSTMKLNGVPDIRVNVPMSVEHAIDRMGKNVVMAIKNKRELTVKGVPRHRILLKDGHTFRRYINSHM